MITFIHAIERVIELSHKESNIIVLIPFHQILFTTLCRRITSTQLDFNLRKWPQHVAIGHLETWQVRRKSENFRKGSERITDSTRAPPRVNRCGCSPFSAVYIGIDKLYHIILYRTAPRLSKIRTHISGDRHWLHK